MSIRAPTGCLLAKNPPEAKRRSLLYRRRLRITRTGTCEPEDSWLKPQIPLSQALVGCSALRSLDDKLGAQRKRTAEALGVGRLGTVEDHRQKAVGGI